MNIHLFFHLVTHVLLGGVVTYCMLPKTNWINSSILVAIGMLCGILPDIIEIVGIDAAHSLLLVPIIAVCLGWIGNKFVKGIPIKRLTIIFSFALVIAHILYDCLESGKKVFYPITDEEFEIGIITHGDPWIWIPLVIGIMVFLIMKCRDKKPLMIALVCISAYLIFKMGTKLVITQQLKVENSLSNETILIVEPNDTYEYPINPLSWLEFKFIIMDDHFTIRGYRGGLTNQGNNSSFYPDENEIILTPYGSYIRKDDPKSYYIKEILQEEDKDVVVGESNGELHVFEESGDGWTEVIGEQKDIILSQIE